VGKPLKLNIDGLKITGEIRQQIADEMMYHVATMLPPEYHGEYTDMSKFTQTYVIPA
jgi:hypothetical protein